MEIRHLQSLIKRNSNQIAMLEGILEHFGYAYDYEAERYIKNNKKEIKALANLQRVLKDEIAYEIFCMRVDKQTYKTMSERDRKNIWACHTGKELSD